MYQHIKRAARYLGWHSEQDRLTQLSWSSHSNAESKQRQVEQMFKMNKARRKVF